MRSASVGLRVALWPDVVLVCDASVLDMKEHIHDRDVRHKSGASP
jgi:hypothetical protein